MRLAHLAIATLGMAGCATLVTPTPVDAPTVLETPAAPATSATVVVASPTTVVAAAATPVALPAVEDDSLTLAAKCLEQGDHPKACVHLEAYVRTHPDQLMFRAHLAELLFKLDRMAEARTHFEQFVASAQDATGAPRVHLVHCHTRLMEIAQRDDDRFTELLHRSIGLLKLVEQQDAEPTRDDGFREEILCKTLKALAEARDLRPNDSRIHLYLADAHDRLGNRRAADLERALARNTSVPGSLTPSESRRLEMLRGN